MADSSLRLVLLLREIPREPHYVSTKVLQHRLADAGHQVSLRTVTYKRYRSTFRWYKASHRTVAKPAWVERLPVTARTFPFL